MLDQSFSSDNFRILLDVVNRKGVYVESESFFETADIFIETREKSDEIIWKNKEIRSEKRKIKAIKDKALRDYSNLDQLNAEKEEIKQEREILLTNIFNNISSKVNKEDFKLDIKKGKIKYGKQLYVVTNSPENFFALKQIQRNINKTFKVKQSDRRVIISQLSTILQDGFPKVILRTDIKEFYESIPHKGLLDIINGNPLLSYPTKRIIKDLLNQYWKILVSDGIKNSTDERIGIPRGIGISALLAELYMRRFDKAVKSIDSVTYYARYVDDIITIYTPKNRGEKRTSQTYIERLKTISQKSLGLTLNSDKTHLIDLRKRNRDRKNSKRYKFTYLGYSFVIDYKRKELSGDSKKFEVYREPLKILMSEHKLEKYKNKIENAFADFKDKQALYAGKESGIKRLLHQRIRFLTNNYQLFRRKSNVFIGVYFSNEFLNNPYPDLKALDDFLENEITKIEHLANPELINKLRSLSFYKGFMAKNVLQFNASKEFNINKLMSIWTNM
ncbi:RNA-directed DNA polymerase [Carboxylicivirga sp. A043]|uniref:antiviral reverse transcriptase Drt3a n=1 Tax=Carboxylicivirga litoralis TaxID=2816963 RepID=UPI0021CB3053|nr:antiviral reverse transcriptase Drt3a [Carboxylicivirga sp. A043]MCU4158378.1 RNA-directed DNA polymerase [Carboxylicivirga sp. A043]